MLLSDNGWTDLKRKLLEAAISMGANVNVSTKTRRGYERVFDIVQNKETYNFLQNQGAHCSDRSFIAKYFFNKEIFEKLPFGIQDIAKGIVANIDAPKNEFEKIPYIMHHVWLTHPLSPQEIDSSDLDIIINNHKLLEKQKKTCAHIIWTNKKSLLPKSVFALEKYNANFECKIEVREIQELKENFPLFEKVQSLIEQKLYGMASDIVRYNVVKILGGIYTDLNFKITRDIEEELYKYDFFSESLVNNFFASTADHPIMSSVLKKIEANFLTPSPYITALNQSDILMKTVYSTFYPFGLGILESINTDNNIDMVFPDRDSGSGSWPSTDTCPYYSSFFGFEQHLGICTQLKVGIDGYNGGQLTWLEI